MSVAKVIELSARSTESFEAAIVEGVNKAGETINGVQSAWVKNMNVHMENGQITEYEVDLKITFVVR